MKIKELLNQEQKTISHIPVLFYDLNSDERTFLLRTLIRKAEKTLLDETQLLVLFDVYDLENWNRNWPIISDRSIFEAILQGHKMIWQGKNFTFNLTTSPIVYTIMNITPDSFHDGSSDNLLVSSFLKKAELALIDGASVLELGGKSSRPGYQDISPKEEWNRLKGPLTALKEQFPQVTIAVDTDEPFVMERVLDAGVDIINDIDGFDTDEKLNIISAYKPAVVAMNNGRAGYPYSEELFDNLDQAFSKKKLELMECGLDPRQIAIDPGVGFFDPKRGSDSLLRAKSSELLSRTGLPVMIAISNKRFLNQDFDLSDDERLLGTIMLEGKMMDEGGRILRVHDTKATSRLIKAYQTYKRV